MSFVAASTELSAPVQPMLHAADLAETMRWWVDVLGFTVMATWPDAERPTWCALASGPARIMFTNDPSEGALSPSLTGSIYLYPADVDACFAHVRARAQTLTEPRDEAFGMREFALEDPNGYLVKLGQPTASG